MGRLSEKVAIITGGSGGFGAAAVRLFLAEGASVMAVDNDAAELDRLDREIDSERLAVEPADVADPAAVEAYTQAAVKRFGGLDAVVLNAGITGPNVPLEDYPLEAFDAVLAVNLKGVWLGLRAAIPHMKRRGGGSAVLTSSIQGLSAMGGTSAYTTTKHALLGTMRSAALELAKDNIRVNTIHPGFADTPMMDRIHRSAAPDDPKAIEGVLSSGIPMRRYGSADEIARLMLFLVSDESSYCTGAAYPADGGLLASWGPTPH